MTTLLLGLANFYFHFRTRKAVKAVSAHIGSINTQIAKNVSNGVGGGSGTRTGRTCYRYNGMFNRHDNSLLIGRTATLMKIRERCLNARKPDPSYMLCEQNNQASSFFGVRCETRDLPQWGQKFTPCASPVWREFSTARSMSRLACSSSKSSASRS